MSDSPHRRDDFTLGQAQELATALIPHFQAAMKDDLDALRVEIRDGRKEVQEIRTELAWLKGRSTFWGGLGGILGGVLANFFRHS